MSDRAVIEADRRPPRRRSPSATPPSARSPPTASADAAALLVRVDDDVDLRTGRSTPSPPPASTCWWWARAATSSSPTPASPGSRSCWATRFAAIEVDGTDVEAGAAAALPVVARRTVAAGLTGFEWAVGVPGSIGGAVRMNAGGHGSDMAAVLAGVRVVDLRTGEDGWVPASRPRTSATARSAVAPHHLVLAARLALAAGDVERGTAELAEIVAWRRANQPGGPNAGSVFTNPPGDSAGRLIDAAGGKGRRHGTAAVSTKHANFIQADEGGRADDVRRPDGRGAGARPRPRRRGAAPETRLVGFDRRPST